MGDPDEPTEEMVGYSSQQRARETEERGSVERSEKKEKKKKKKMHDRVRKAARASEAEAARDDGEGQDDPVSGEGINAQLVQRENVESEEVGPLQEIPNEVDFVEERANPPNPPPPVSQIEHCEGETSKRVQMKLKLRAKAEAEAEKSVDVDQEFHSVQERALSAGADAVAEQFFSAASEHTLHTLHTAEVTQLKADAMATKRVSFKGSKHPQGPHEYTHAPAHPTKHGGPHGPLHALQSEQIATNKAGGGDDAAVGGGGAASQEIVEEDEPTERTTERKSDDPEDVGSNEAPSLLQSIEQIAAELSQQSAYLDAECKNPVECKNPNQNAQNRLLRGSTPAGCTVLDLQPTHPMGNHPNVANVANTVNTPTVGANQVWGTVQIVPPVPSIVPTTSTGLQIPLPVAIPSAAIPSATSTTSSVPHATRKSGVQSLSVHSSIPSLREKPEMGATSQDNPQPEVAIRSRNFGLVAGQTSMPLMGQVLAGPSLQMGDVANFKAGVAKIPSSSSPLGAKTRVSRNLGSNLPNLGGQLNLEFGRGNLDADTDGGSKSDRKVLKY